MKLLLSIFLAAIAIADMRPSAEEKAAIVEMEAKIKVLKAEGKLPDTPDPVPASSNKLPASGCVRLGIGQAAVISATSEESPTGVETQYGLSRPEDKRFLAEINLKFVKGNGYTGPENEKELQDKYNSRVGGCLKQYEGKLLNLKTQASITLRLTENPAVPQRTIEVMSDNFRSNSFQYEADIDCPSILHETLHLLGLADEYPHKPGLTEVFYDCRPAAPIDSIMGNHWEAHIGIEPRMGYSIEKCKCDSPGIACWELSMKSNGRVCPPGSTSIFEKLDPGIKSSLNVLNSNESFVLDVGRMAEAGFQAPAKGSILYPAHFRSITEPGCRDVNEVYYSCSLNSYRFSKPSTTDAAADPRFGCKPTPEACRWRSFKWLE